jgi:uncharacterized protein YjiS (DUF1127 family)
MTIFELGRSERRPASLVSLVRHLWMAAREWHLCRVALWRIAQMPEHLRRDIGIEPDDGDEPQDDPTVVLWKKAHLPPNVR